jgi:hypothetical protein
MDLRQYREQFEPLRQNNVYKINLMNCLTVLPYQSQKCPSIDLQDKPNLLNSFRTTLQNLRST